MTKKKIFDFLTQVMIVFAFIVIMLNIFCAVFGDRVQDFSSIFAMGNEGVPVGIVFQFLCVSILVVGIRFIFTSDLFVKKMQERLRILCMLALIFIVIVVFVALFGWFPIGQRNAWLLFFVCYGVSFVGSYFISMMKMNLENRQLDEALQRLKNNQE